MSRKLDPVYHASPRERLDIAKAINKENKTYGKKFIEIDCSRINGIKCVWRNRDFLVQLYDDGNWKRLTINRTSYDPVLNTWKGDITWDELMYIKRKVGFGDMDAIEIYPNDKDIEYVSNMRHLFLLEDRELDCIWRKKR